MRKGLASTITRKDGGQRREAVLPCATNQQQRYYIRKLIRELAETQPGSRLLQSTLTENTPPKEASSDAILVHELSQPLFTMSMASESLRIALEAEEIDRAGMRQTVRRIADQIQRAQAIIDQVASTASGRVMAAESCDVVAAVAGAAHLLDLAIAPDLEISWLSSDQEMLVAMNRIELEQVFINVLRNARDSIKTRKEAGWDGKGRIAITMDSYNGEMHCLVADNGAGLTACAPETVFQPFFTTKGDDGTGLGLHICRQALHNAQGTIHIAPGALEGAMVEIRLPLFGQEHEVRQTAG